MYELIKQKLQFKKKSYPLSRKKLFSKQPYKLELIKELQKTKKPISIYKTAEFIDLCAGPHVKSTSEIDPNSFKLTKIAGAYWKGDEKNPMLTRIYGMAFDTKKELDDYLKIQAEIEKEIIANWAKNWIYFLFAILRRARFLASKRNDYS